MPLINIQSGQRLPLDVGDREYEAASSSAVLLTSSFRFYMVYGAHDAEPNLYNLLPEEQEKFADIVAAYAI